MEKLYDLAIIGSGPSGITCSIYASRANLKVALIEKGAPGGKLVKTYHIENYPAIKESSGVDLALSMFDHATAFGSEFVYGDVSKVNDLGDIKEVIFASGEKVQAKSIYIATGTDERLMNIENENKMIGRGVSFCAVCDGSFYKGQDVVVVGGGNAALEESIYLTQFVNKVTIVVRRDVFRAEPLVIEEAYNNPKIEIITKYTPNKVIVEDNKVAGLEITSVETGESKVINCQGIFPYIGAIPATAFVKDLDITNEQGYILVDEKMQTKIKGIYAGGDVIVKQLRQVVTATSDGAIAAHNITKYLKSGE
ncbi:MAG: FAD-dependent oxidoreductase [Erysipelotrichaceae bacterium]